MPFHRVIDGFMAQTGDGQYGNGTGGSKHPNLKAEFSKVPFKRGIVGMARTSDPNSANSQFFIMFAEGSFLNSQYTVVGEVVQGMELVDKLKKGQRRAGAVTDPDRIVKNAGRGRRQVGHLAMRLGAAPFGIVVLLALVAGSPAAYSEDGKSGAPAIELPLTTIKDVQNAVRKCWAWPPIAESAQAWTSPSC